MADFSADTDDATEALDEVSILALKTRLAGDVLRLVGTGLQYIGALGVVVWGFITYLSWDRFGPGLGHGDWKAQVYAILSPFSVLVFAALAIGVGAGCRLLAQWSALRLTDDYFSNDTSDAVD